MRRLAVLVVLVAGLVAVCAPAVHAGSSPPEFRLGDHDASLTVDARMWWEKRTSGRRACPPGTPEGGGITGRRDHGLAESSGAKSRKGS